MHTVVCVPLYPLLPTKIPPVKAMVSQVVHVGMWELDHKESWASKNWCFWIVVLGLSRVPLTARSNQSILKETNLEYSLERLILKFQYFGHLMWRDIRWKTHWKRPWYWERLRAGGEGVNRGWDSWTASLTQWTWVWENSGKTAEDRGAWHAAVHGVTKVGQDWATEWQQDPLSKDLLPSQLWGQPQVQRAALPGLALPMAWGRWGDTGPDSSSLQPSLRPQGATLAPELPVRCATASLTTLHLPPLSFHRLWFPGKHLTSETPP